MLPKIRRLSRPDFLHAQKTGTSHRFADFNLIHCLSSLSFSRFAVVISAKISKRAVIRNRLKRKIYSVVGRLPATGDFIIIPRVSMLSFSDEEINSCLHQALSEISKL